MIRRADALRSALQATAISEPWRDWAKDQPPTTRADAAAVKAAVLDDKLWEGARDVLSIMDPIYATLRHFDTAEPRSSEVSADLCPERAQLWSGSGSAQVVSSV
jgi:hypothetical protein